MVRRSLAVVAAVFLAGVGLMGVTGAGVNLWTGGAPLGYRMPAWLQWALLAVVLIPLVAVEAACARRRLWLALPLIPVGAYLGLVAGILGSLIWPLDLLLLAAVAVSLRALRPHVLPGAVEGG